MRNLKILILLLAVLAHLPASAQWEWVNPWPTGNDLYDIHAIDANTAIAVGGGQTILRTIDGGTSWATVHSGGTQSLKSVFFTDANTGYAAGGDGMILKTTNAGATWSELNSGITNLLEDIFFPSANTGYAVGWSGKVIKTNDAGANWTELNNPTTGANRQVFFIDDNTGYFGGQHGMYKTTDGGANWTLITTPAGTGGNVGMYFLDASTGFMGDVYTTQKTTDGGATWTQVGTFTPNNIYFTDANTGYSATYSGWSNGPIYKTTDGGDTWTTDVNLGKFNLDRFSFVDANTAYGVGPAGTIVKTTDAWATATVISKNVVTENNKEFYTVHFTDANTGYAIGRPGVYKSSDGGDSWAKVSNANYQDLTATSFADANTVYMLKGWNQALVKTTDGGANWSQIDIKSNGIGEAHSMYFTSASTGFIGNKLSKIYKTTDGGNTWTEKANYNGAAGSFNDFYFIDANTGFAVANDIYKTTDGGETWAKVAASNSKGAISGITFIDGSNGFAVGAFYQILKTTDGGDNWTRIHEDGSSWSFLDVEFPSSTVGYALGEEGAVFKTTDGGSNWTELESGVNIRIRDAHFFDDSKGVLVGESGFILKTTNGGSGGGANNPPTPPSNLQAVAWNKKPATKIKLTWDDNSNNEDGFIIWRSPNDETNYTTLDSTAADVTEYIDENVQSGITYYYQVTAWNQYGASAPSPSANSTLTAIQELTFSDIAKLYPNPLEGSGTMILKLPQAQQVTLEVMDISGKSHGAILNETLPAGSTQVNIDISHLSSGLYILKLQTGEQILTGKMLKR